MTLRSVMTGVDDAPLADVHEMGAYTGTSSLKSKNVTGYGPSASVHYSPNVTLGADEEVPQKTKISISENGKPATGKLDGALLKRAKTIIDSFNYDDVIESTINIESLRAICVVSIFSRIHRLDRSEIAMGWRSLGFGHPL